MRRLSVGLINGEPCIQCMVRIKHGYQGELNLDSISAFTDLFHVNEPHDLIYCFEEFDDV